MPKPVVFAFVLAGCGTLHMEAPTAFVTACPSGDYKCQRNADAQTLAYIGKSEAAARLMCQDANVAAVMQNTCKPLPALY